MKAQLLTTLTMAVLLIGSAWTAGPLANAADIDEMIANAKTAADHQAIANYYDQQAAQAREQVARHQKMSKAYETSPSLQGAWVPGFRRVGMKDCHVLGHSYENIATQDEALAKMHRDAAAKLGGSH